MYVCESCGKQVEPERKAKKNFEYRTKQYKNYTYEYNPKTKKKEKKEFITEGFEINKEYLVCGDCHVDKD